MSQIFEQALVLDSHPYRDRDLLLALLSPRLGVVRGVLRRARGGRAPQAAAAQVLSLVRVTGFAGPHAELATFQRLELVTSSFPVAADLDRAAAAAVTAELLATFCSPGEAAPRRFRLGTSLLDALLEGGRPDALVAYAEYWILTLSGLFPGVEEAPVDASGRRFLEECRVRPPSELNGTPPGETARWLDRRVREEAERPLRALDFLRRHGGADAS